MICVYDRAAAVDYAKEWALRRNPRFMLCSSLKGSESASFVSQCVCSGSGIMGMEEKNGWYYKTGKECGLAWRNDEALCRFLLNNRRRGPRGIEVDKNGVHMGDIVQLLAKNSCVVSSAIVTDINSGEIFTCSHGLNSFMRPVDSYCCSRVRYIHIVEVKI